MHSNCLRSHKKIFKDLKYNKIIVWDVFDVYIILKIYKYNVELLCIVKCFEEYIGNIYGLSMAIRMRMERILFSYLVGWNDPVKKKPMLHINYGQLSELSTNCPNIHTL